MKASLITIGTEILIGQIIDTNSAYIGEKLGLLGIDLVSRITISDVREDILKALNRASEDADIILITGGLGPTKDDITKKVMAEYLDRPMYFDEEAHRNIISFFENINRQATESHRLQCFFPEGTQFLKNNLGTAPGMLFEKNKKKYFSMPGVPYEMKDIMENEILPMLMAEQNQIIQHKTILTVGRGESDIAESIAHIEDDLPEGFSLAYLPSLGSVRLRITGKGNDQDKVVATLLELQSKIESEIGDIIYGHDLESLSESIGQILIKKGQLMATAESCTGGNIAQIITSKPGASAYFNGSIVAYQNALKINLLEVKASTLREHGAVSEQTVLEMLDGILRKTHAHVGIAVSGIAGPGGGTPEKPVGTIWIAVGSTKEQKTLKLQLRKNREQNIEYTSFAALNMLRKFLLA